MSESIRIANAGGTPLAVAEDTQRFFRLIPWGTESSEVRVVLLGDSTVADFASNSGFSSDKRGRP